MNLLLLFNSGKVRIRKKSGLFIRNALFISLILSMYCCSHSSNPIVIMHEDVAQMNEQIEIIDREHRSEWGKRQKILSEIYNTVEMETPISEDRTRIVKQSAELHPGTPGDIESTPLDFSAVPAQEVAESTQPVRGTSDADELFRNAYANYNNGEYTTAAEGFLLAYRYAEKPVIKSRCLYWVGECHFRNRDWNLAIQTYTQLEREFPSHPILASALLKKGYAHIENREVEKGKLVLQSSHPALSSYKRSSFGQGAAKRIELKRRPDYSTEMSSFAC